MYTNLQQFEEEKVKELEQLKLHIDGGELDGCVAYHESTTDFLRTAIRQSAELTVEAVKPNPVDYGYPENTPITYPLLQARADNWLSNEQPQ